MGGMVWNDSSVHFIVPYVYSRQLPPEKSSDGGSAVNMVLRLAYKSRGRFPTCPGKLLCNYGRRTSSYFLSRQRLHVGLVGLLQGCIFLTVIQNILETCLAEMVGNRNIPIVLRAFCSRRFGYVELSVAGLNNDWNVLSRAHLVGVKGRPEQ